MKFVVLDKQTLQCVMTKAEAADYGMDRKAIYENDKRTEDFFREIMQKAQQETGFVKNRGNVAVHAAFLSDEKLEITFYAEMKNPVSEELQEYKAVPSAVFRAKKLDHMIQFCKKAPGGLKSCLYKYHGSYFMLADLRDLGLQDAAALFILADEYMNEICSGQSIAGFLEEHGQCIVKENVTDVLGGI